MKQLMIGLVAACLLGSCTQIAGSSDTIDSTSGGVDSTTIYRDESINQANAYSDLFLDSNAVESFITQEKMSEAEASLFRNFYKVRNYQYAWFSTNGLTEGAHGLWGLYASADDEKGDSTRRTEKSLKKEMDTLLANDSLRVTPNDSSFAHTELALTGQLVQYASEHPSEGINPRTIYYLVPARKLTALEWADSILNRQKDTSRYASNKMYTALKGQLGTYYNLAKNGGWGTIPAGASLKKGMQAPAVVLLKKRLQATGEYGGKDTSAVFDATLEEAVKGYQLRNGYQPTGMVNDSLVNELNISAEQRLQQILVNMNRSLWMQPLTDSNRIQVNIPSFMLDSYEGSQKVFSMPVIVGKEGSGTVMFSGSINQIVFNPYWNLPESIVEKEILPKMKNDPGYLKKNHMEIVSSDGKVPQIRQLPGKDNALGRVKFLFPNSFDIYLHDTPNKELFAKNDRAMSHGCIRMADPNKLAEYLLQGQSGWDAGKISTAMSNGKEQKVDVKNPRLVSITYYTAWVDENGMMNFRKDIYGHDQDTGIRMFMIGG